MINWPQICKSSEVFANVVLFDRGLNGKKRENHQEKMAVLPSSDRSSTYAMARSVGITKRRRQFRQFCQVPTEVPSMRIYTVRKYIRSFQDPYKESLLSSSFSLDLEKPLMCHYPPVHRSVSVCPRWRQVVARLSCPEPQGMVGLVFPGSASQEAVD